MLGRADGMKVKTFADYSDGDVETKINKFFSENPHAVILDIKYFNGYSTALDSDTYGRETAMVIYRD